MIAMAGSISKKSRKDGLEARATKRGRQDAGPTKGGDGGVYRAPPESRHWRDNGKVVLTGESIGRGREAFLAVCVETIDPCDRAHLFRQREFRDHAPLGPLNSRLAEPEMVHLRRPGCLRRYHPSQVTSRGMPYDSMFDDAALTATRLQHTLNIDLGWRTGFPKSPKVEYTGDTEYERERMFRGMAADQVRDMVRPRVRDGRTADERRLDREASALIAAAEASKKPAVRKSRTNPGIHRGTACPET